MCEEHLNKAKNFVIAASATFAAAPVLVLIAIGLNGGFFTAPGAPVPMLAAAAAVFAAVALLSRAKEALKAWVICGGISPECAGKLSNIENMLAAAMTTIGISGGACAGVAAAAWIPWIPQPGMWAVYVAFVIGAGTLLALQLMWAPLDQCQSDVAASRGRLLPGEKASDPWFLRLNPKEEPRYAKPSSSDVINDDEMNHRWLRCRLLGVNEWLVEAVATIKGTPSAPVTFTWTLSGSPLPSSSIVSDNKQSLLTHKSAPVGDNLLLKVVAKDASGFTRSMDDEIDLSKSQLDCKAVLPLLPVRIKSPVVPWTPERLRPAMEIFMRTIREIEEGDIPNEIKKERMS